MWIPFLAAHRSRYSGVQSLLVALEYREWICKSAMYILSPLSREPLCRQQKAPVSPTLYSGGCVEVNEGTRSFHMSVSLKNGGGRDSYDYSYDSRPPSVQEYLFQAFPFCSLYQIAGNKTVFLIDRYHFIAHADNSAAATL